MSYLQAETAAYPELRRRHARRRSSYAESFDEALRGLFMDDEAGELTRGLTGWRELAGRAESAFEDDLSALGEGEFDEKPPKPSSGSRRACGT